MPVITFDLPYLYELLIRDQMNLFTFTVHFNDKIPVGITLNPKEINRVLFVRNGGHVDPY